MQHTNMNIILDSASSSNRVSMSRSLLMFSWLSMMDSLKNELSCPILSDFDKYTLFCLRSPMIVSNSGTVIGGTLFSLNTSERVVLMILKSGMLAELGKRKRCSFSL